jgi:hypothetical protein
MSIPQDGQGGVCAMATAKPLVPDVPTENAVAFIETVCEQGGV